MIAVATAAPSYGFKEDSDEVVPIIIDEREITESGEYNFRFATGNDIYRSESGAPIEDYSGEGGYAQHGSYS